MSSSAIGNATLNLVRHELAVLRLLAKTGSGTLQPRLHELTEGSGDNPAEVIQQIAISIFSSCPDRSKYAAGERGDTLYRHDVGEWENKASRDMERLEKLDAQVRAIPAPGCSGATQAKH